MDGCCYQTRISAHTIFRKTVFLCVNYPTKLSYLPTAALFNPGVGVSYLPLKELLSATIGISFGGQRNQFLSVQELLSLVLPEAELISTSPVESVTINSYNNKK